MDTLLSHTTALQVLRSVVLRRRLERGERSSAALPELPPTREEASAALGLFPELSLPLHVTVSSRNRIGPSDLVETHVSRVPLPRESVIRLGEGLYCSSPEHVLVQMAPRLSLLELIFLLGELLGTYAISPEHDTGMFQRRNPITTKERILGHLRALGPVPGTALVRRALSMVCEGSASPYETRLSMRLGLKPALGGYNLNVLSMNQPLKVTRIGSSLGKGVRKPDVLLGGCEGAPFSGVSFDYNGRVHETIEHYELDLRRQNELLAIGFKNYVLTKALYDNLDYMDDLIRQVRQDLGLPRQHHTRREEERRRARRQRLHDELELIDGITWGGREREKGNPAAARQIPAEEVIERVPLSAYGLE